MKHVAFPDLQISYNLPENLAECNAYEYEAISSLVFEYLSAAISYEDFRVQAVCKLLNIKVSEKFQNDEEIMANIYYLSELMSGYFEDTEEGNKKIRLDFLHIKIPIKKIGLQSYYGPSHSIFEITYGEFADASRFFDDFHASGDVNFLYLLASVLYRRKRYFNKNRLPYDSKKLDQTVSYFKKFAPPSFIYAVYLQFTAFRQYLPTAQIPWGGNILDFEILFEDSEIDTDKSIPGIGADSMVFSLAESGVFGSAEKVRSTNFLEIMIHLYDLRKRDIEKQQKEKQNVSSK